MPDPVRKEFGQDLYVAQCGDKHANAKPLKGFGSGVLEIVERHDGDTYWAVYTVRFDEAIYVLQVFQKKAHEGIKTPQKELDVIAHRLQRAQKLHEEYIARQQKDASKGAER